MALTISVWIFLVTDSVIVPCRCDNKTADAVWCDITDLAARKWFFLEEKWRLPLRMALTFHLPTHKELFSIFRAILACLWFIMREKMHVIRYIKDWRDFFVFVGWRNSLLEINVDIQFFYKVTHWFFFSPQGKKTEKRMSKPLKHLTVMRIFKT